MNPASETTLKLLRQRKKKGVTLQDFPKGFRLGARIYDLRQLGYKIITAQYLPIARYVLLNDPRS